MRGVTPLAVIVGSGDRAPTALAVAAAAAALGRPVAMLFDGDSVRALDAADPALAAALDLGVAVTACQSGLAAAGIAASALPAGVTTGGMIGFLRDAEAAQWLLA